MRRAIRVRRSACSRRPPTCPAGARRPRNRRHRRSLAGVRGAASTGARRCAARGRGEDRERPLTRIAVAIAARVAVPPRHAAGRAVVRTRLGAPRSSGAAATAPRPRRRGRARIGWAGRPARHVAGVHGRVRAALPPCPFPRNATAPGRSSAVPSRAARCPPPGAIGQPPRARGARLPVPARPATRPVESDGRACRSRPPEAGSWPGRCGPAGIRRPLAAAARRRCARSGCGSPRPRRSAPALGRAAPAATSVTPNALRPAATAGARCRRWRGRSRWARPARSLVRTEGCPGPPGRAR